ncbi:uncharacterized protein LOC113215928 [Frankliniella occidentalis]|uniref:Uncharacterized protein LOC113215928 n=1 Tax=Frankliniella occidentalis TaxID=133901 RepID=A0A9C6X8H8_FRAOC|nr:uncharacterized protein LOC113215928 [Frankliniella occidentalis]
MEQEGWPAPALFEDLAGSCEEAYPVLLETDFSMEHEAWPAPALFEDLAGSCEEDPVLLEADIEMELPHNVGMQGPLEAPQAARNTPVTPAEREARKKRLRTINRRAKSAAKRNDPKCNSASSNQAPQAVAATETPEERRARKLRLRTINRRAKKAAKRNVTLFMNELQKGPGNISYYFQSCITLYQSCTLFASLILKQSNAMFVIVITCVSEIS